MRYKNVCLESLGYVLPSEIVTSDELETRLSPLYERLRLPEGRLEMMTGIRERRFWPSGTMPSDVSQRSGELAIQAAGFDAAGIGALVHGSVCRDHLEPATACRVHWLMGLPAHCVVYDVSNACLGMINGVLQLANMIELGQVDAGLVVGTEDARPLVENTIATLNSDESLTRQSVKSAIASLTIGSASCAMLLVHRRLSRFGNRLVGAATRSETDHHRLCQSLTDQAGAAMKPLMSTDSQGLMQQGIATGMATFADFFHQIGWKPGTLDRTICHQVGTAHRQQMLESLELDIDADFSTFPWLGNTGSVALPITLAKAAESGFLVRGNQLALLGIGSGINCIMLGIDWQDAAISGQTWDSKKTTALPQALIS
jgi:3-oxoacyl-[acyl-carrier-protein] synthase-3